MLFFRRRPARPPKRSRRLRPPVSPDAVIVPEPNGALDAHAVFELMSGAEDWRPNPDPRTPMAIALGHGWVFKSQLLRRRRQRLPVERDVVRMIRLTASLRIWHPAKTWFLMRDRGRYLVCSATPRLRLPSEVRLRFLRVARLRHRLVERARRAGYRLDWKADNFGFAPASWRLYYLDDEVYPLKKG